MEAAREECPHLADTRAQLHPGITLEALPVPRQSVSFPLALATKGTNSLVMEPMGRAQTKDRSITRANKLLWPTTQHKPSEIVTSSSSSSSSLNNNRRVWLLTHAGVCVTFTDTSWGVLVACFQLLEGQWALTMAARARVPTCTHRAEIEFSSGVARA